MKSVKYRVKYFTQLLFPQSYSLCWSYVLSFWKRIQTTWIWFRLVEYTQHLQSFCCNDSLQVSFGIFLYRNTCCLECIEECFIVLGSQAGAEVRGSSWAGMRCAVDATGAVKEFQTFLKPTRLFRWKPGPAWAKDLFPSPIKPGQYYSCEVQSL